MLNWGKGALTKSSSISTDKLEEFLLLFNDLSSEWLLRGNGEMLRSIITPSSIILDQPQPELNQDESEKDELIELLMRTVKTYQAREDELLLRVEQLKGEIDQLKTNYKTVG